MKRIGNYCLMFLFWFGALAQAETTGYIDTLKKIQSTGKIVIGYSETTLPFSYLNSTQKPIGYTVELCEKVVDRIKNTLKMPRLTIQYYPVTPQTRIPLIMNGTIDLECSTATHTLERQKIVEFSNTFYLANVRILTKAGSGIKELADLSGKTIVITAGSTADNYIKRYMQNYNKQIDIIYRTDDTKSFAALSADQAVAFITDDILLTSLSKNAGKSEEYLLVGTPIASAPYAIMLRKDNPEFKRIVDLHLVHIMQSKEMMRLYHKWFMQPIPPTGINIQQPISQALKAALADPTDDGI